MEKDSCLGDTLGAKGRRIIRKENRILRKSSKKKKRHSLGNRLIAGLARRENDKINATFDVNTATNSD